MAQDLSATQSRLPDPGAGFVWDSARHGAGVYPVLRPQAGGCVAAYTTRRGGVSQAPYDELNASMSVGDNLVRVFANRDLAGRTIGRDGRWSVVKQEHGTEIVPANDARPPWPADGHWTNDPERTLAVFSADCVLILLVGDGRIGLVHAGWRGLVAGVIENAIAVVGPSAVYGGPAIGPCCFEVGETVREGFADRFGAAVLAEPSHVDLWGAAAMAASESGVRSVHMARLCTSCNPSLFFSHRRDRGVTGRQVLVARVVGS